MFKYTCAILMALFLTSNIAFADSNVSDVYENHEVIEAELITDNIELSEIDLLSINAEVFIAQSCFSFYHGLFHEYYGGITLDNVADFNYLVAQCQALFENNE